MAQKSLTVSNGVLDNLEDFHVLVIDDDPIFLEFVELVLQALRVKKITRALSGAEGGAKLIQSQTPVDVVLCDYAMANGSGLELLQAVRLGKIKYCRADVCFIFLT